MTQVRSVTTATSVRIYLNDVLHVDFRRDVFLGLQTWRWPPYFAIEISLIGGRMQIDYDSEELWLRIVGELEQQNLTGLAASIASSN